MLYENVSVLGIDLEQINLIFRINFENIQGYILIKCPSYKCQLKIQLLTVEVNMSNCKLQETSFTNKSSSSKSIDGSSSNLNITEKPSEKRPNLYQLGPVKKHHTTDVSCAYCFIVFVVIWIMIPLLGKYQFSSCHYKLITFDL